MKGLNSLFDQLVNFMTPPVVEDNHCPQAQALNSSSAVHTPDTLYSIQFLQMYFTSVFLYSATNLYSLIQTPVNCVCLSILSYDGTFTFGACTSFSGILPPKRILLATRYLWDFEGTCSSFTTTKEAVAQPASLKALGSSM